MNGEVAAHVRKMAGMDARQRLRYLQALIGPQTRASQELQFRALLMTKLNETGTWPPRTRRQAS